MKLFAPLLFLSLIFVGAGCVSQSSDTEPVEETTPPVVESLNLPNGSFTLKSDQSSIEWEASKVKVTHNGTVQAALGAIQIEEGQVTDGRVTVDMTSLKNLDQEGKFLEMLENHLKGPDFFDVTQFPTAEFVVSTVEPMSGIDGANARIDGELTMKGTTKPLSLPAWVVVQDGAIRLTGRATVDRTLYDIQFGSGKFFENLGDGLIDDEFYLDLDLVFGPTAP